MKQSLTEKENSTEGIGQQQIDHDIFEKQTSSMNIIHVGKYNNSTTQSEGKVTLWKQKETNRNQPQFHNNKNSDKNQNRKWIQKQCKWIEKQYKHIQKQCQFMQTQYQHTQKINKKNADMKKQIKHKYQHLNKTNIEKTRKFVQKQQPKQYKQKIKNTTIPIQSITNQVHIEHVEDNLNQANQIFVDQKITLLEQSKPYSQNNNLEITLINENIKEEDSPKTSEVLPQISAISPINSSQPMEIEQIQIDFAPRRTIKLSDKNTNKREEIILNRLAFDYSQHCQEQSLIFQQQHQEYSQQQPKQILHEVLQKNQSPMSSLEIEFRCGNNILEVKVSNIELTALKLSVCLQQKSQKIQTRSSCIDQHTLSNYVQFQQICHTLPYEYRSNPLYRSYTLCKIITTSENTDDIKCELVQVQALILKCFCGAKNFCPMNAGQSLPLSCRQCSAPLEIHISRLEIIKP